MLCELAHSFPHFIAKLLERDKDLTRNFGETTVTDLLMASLIGLAAFDILFDFPDEQKTGGDMEWIYVAKNDDLYFRVIMQAKRAKRVALKGGDYWYYDHLAHGTPPGQQAQTLVSHAATAPGTLPLYILYHPTSALASAVPPLPAIEGVNLVFARDVASVVGRVCTKDEKKADYWRNRFMPLSDLLCRPVLVPAPGEPAESDARRFMSGGFHPDLVARRFRDRWEKISVLSPAESPPPAMIEPAVGIPSSILRAIDGQITPEERKALKRPRVIFTTHLPIDR